MTDSKAPVLAIFASDKGPGDAERASIMSEAGKALAKKGAHLLCLGDASLPTAFVTAAKAAGGRISIYAGEDYQLPAALADLPVERIADEEERLAQLGARADGFVGLPGSLASATALFRTWTLAGAGAAGKPVAFLNRRNAFEVMRGFAQDVVSHTVSDLDRVLIFSDNLDDLWNRLQRALTEN